MRPLSPPISAAAALLLLASVAPPSHAQERTTVVGVVRDSSGAPVAQADVGIPSLRVLVRTNDSGVFQLRNVPQGPRSLSIRRLGYDPRELQVVALPGADTVRVVLRMQAAMLPGITVSEQDMRRRIAIEDFYRRRARGPGSFITRDEIEARHASRTSDALRTLPGLEFARTRGGVTSVRFVSAAFKRRDCVPQIWLDGTRAPGLEVDELPVSDVEGIEVYDGPSTTPLQFSQGAITSCGTIVIWSRVPGT